MVAVNNSITVHSSEQQSFYTQYPLLSGVVSNASERKNHSFNGSCAQLLVQTLEKLGVRFVFGLPGAKIDAVFDALVDSDIRLIVCRHEQNAAFMAGAHGRLTGEPGVALVTSGPGVSNLITGMLTANTEADPMIAIGGNASRTMLYKESHQSASNTKLLEGATKFCQEVYLPDNISATVVNAFRTATAPKSGAAFISLPMDVSREHVMASVVDVPTVEHATLALPKTLQQAADLINAAKRPVMLLGNEASKAENAAAINAFLKAHPLPVVMTYQASGSLREESVHCFFGRLGLFRNQPGDQLLQQSDMILAVGYNPFEYDPEEWSPIGTIPPLIHINYSMADIHQCFQPRLEVLGSISDNLKQLSSLIDKLPDMGNYADIKAQYESLLHSEKSATDTTETIHPLRFIRKLQEHTTSKTIVASDMGSHSVWMSRYYRTFEPRHFMISNGQQTLGVAIPWAMTAKLLYPDHTIIATMGDGGFLFSANELETAVREKLHFIVFILDSQSYDMVAAQEITKYDRSSGVQLGSFDVVRYAEAFGAIGYRLDDSARFDELMTKALAQSVPVLIHIQVDYSDNLALYQEIDISKGN